MTESSTLKKNRDELEEEMIDQFGYIFCQKCGKNKCGFKFEFHHIVYRSEAPKHPNLHDKINLILLGSECHDWFHKDKSRRDYLIKERNLKDIFENIVIFDKI